MTKIVPKAYMTALAEICLPLPWRAAASCFLDPTVRNSKEKFKRSVHYEKMIADDNIIQVFIWDISQNRIQQLMVDDYQIEFSRG
jgi:hypothetical protein